ncbi:Two-component sensor histidine kinase, contains HisKA and HATPase domains [Hyphomicrobium facile]|uniref:histidine kinase n=1 Tax=Hyphomicrobium facile TaxID=51670 RepID=A0A1I7MW06_9HYPH|nr:Two-component sensor histidine kinase, contains HisKA and HATPase domains [Hyphomicrobium facile]
MGRHHISRRFAAFLTSSATRTLLVWVSIAILSGLAAIVAWQWTVAAGDRVAQTLIYQQGLTKWLSAAQDLEIAQRGYLLTRDPKYLASYETAKKAVDEIHSDFVRLGRNNKELLTWIEAVDKAQQEHLTAIDKSISAVANGSPNAAAALAAHNLDIELSNRLRDQIEATEREQHRRFELRVAQFHDQSFWLLAAMLAILLACAALAMVALIRERQRVAALEITALTLTSANRSLEARVKARTEELAIERDRAESERERAEALLRDVTHRIGNTLSLVVGFINLHIRHTSDPKSLKTLTGARDRIHAIASAQRRMNVVNDLELVRIDTLIQAVLDDVVDTVGEGRISLTVDVPPLLAPAQVATSLCVLTQEFVVNSFKHAFGEDGSGHVGVRLHRCGETGAELIVEDDGNGVDASLYRAAGDEMDKLLHGSASHASDGLGTKIAALLTRQFAGVIACEPVRPGHVRPGTRVTIKLTELALLVPEDEPAAHSMKAAKTTTA